METSTQNMADVKIYEEAVANGCSPKWYDGIIGWAWHCMCPDNLHNCDSQCSAISPQSAVRRRA